MFNMTMTDNAQNVYSDMFSSMRIVWQLVTNVILGMTLLEPVQVVSMDGLSLMEHALLMKKEETMEEVIMEEMNSLHNALKGKSKLMENVLMLVINVKNGMLLLLVPHAMMVGRLQMVLVQPEEIMEVVIMVEATTEEEKQATVLSVL